MKVADDVAPDCSMKVSMNPKLLAGMAQVGGDGEQQLERSPLERARHLTAAGEQGPDSCAGHRTFAGMSGGNSIVDKAGWPSKTCGADTDRQGAGLTGWRTCGSISAVNCRQGITSCR